MKSFCQNSIWEIFYTDSKFGPKIHYAMKIFPRWNFDKNSSKFCREKILVSFKKKFIEIGSILFELIHFKKLLSLTWEWRANSKFKKKYRRLLKQHQILIQISLFIIAVLILYN